MKRFDSEQRKTILDAAIPIFAEHGIKGATTRLIGKAAGVNSALIYYYFENKETLFIETVRLVLGEFFSLLQGRQAPFSGSRDRIQFLVNGFFDYFTKHPDRVRLVTLVLTFHGKLMADALLAFIKSQKNLVPLEVIAEGVKRGELRPVSPIQVWWSVLGVCLFALHIRGVTSHLDPAALPFPLPDFEERRRQIVDLLTGGLAADGGRLGGKEGFEQKVTKKEGEGSKPRSRNT